MELRIKVGVSGKEMASSSLKPQGIFPKIQGVVKVKSICRNTPICTELTECTDLRDTTA